jgi:putative ABC transport system permease protein
VLIIACVNAANLLLARSSRRRHEWQMRIALGASRWRIVRQVLTESLLLALLAAAVGLLLTSWAFGFIAHTVPVQLVIDTRVQTFTIAAVIVTAMAFGLGPALHVATRAADPRGPSQLARGTSQSRVRFILIAAQSALSLGLLATGAQFVNTVRTDFASPGAPGAEHLLIASFDVEPLNMAPAAADDFYARLLERTASLPGVVAAGFASAGPLADAFGPDSSIRFWFEQDGPADGRDSVAALVTRDYFKATGTPLVQGRGFAEADRDSPIRPAIVSQSFAKRFLGSRAVGRSLRVAVGRGPYESAVELIVVGVAGPAAGERGEGVPMLYYSASLAHLPARSLHIKFDRSGQFTLPALQKAVRDVDYRVPIRYAATLRERRDGTDQERRLLADGVAALGIFALALTAGGLSGVVSYLVALRRRELGIRLALGASPSSVVGLVVRQGLLPAAIGAVIGAGGAIAIGLAVRSRLYGASAVDPSALVAAVSLLLATMAIASLVPARYAASVDPAAILRAE